MVDGLEGGVGGLGWFLGSEGWVERRRVDEEVMSGLYVSDIPNVSESFFLEDSVPVSR